MKSFFLWAIVLCAFFDLNAQSLKGTITDENNQPIPFATVFIEEIRSGTTTNVNGQYDIKVAPGKYNVQFKSLGYKTVKMSVDISSASKSLNVVLNSEVYTLSEVTVSAKSEDPAYAIMRRAIALAPYHLREVKYYESLVYLRGTIYIDKMPKLVSKTVTFTGNGQEVKMKTGDVFTEESVLGITFNAPNFYKRKVKSMRSSFPGESSSPMNPVLIIEASFYEPEIMDMVSPLSPDAFQHYQFKYDGYSDDNGHIINKIRVIPRRKSQELFSGYIYVVDKKWCLHSVDLVVTQFWGSVIVRGMFGIVEQGAWLPVSYSFNVTGNYLGIKGRYRYTSSVKYTKTVMNSGLSQYVKPETSNFKEKKKDKSDNIIGQIIAKDELSNRDMKKVSRKIGETSAQIRRDTLTIEKIKALTLHEIDTMARKQDTAYWNEFRPVPLTAEEIKSFEEGPNGVLQKVKKDSINMAKDSSYAKKKGRSPIWIVTGREFRNKSRSVNFRYQGLIQPGMFSFNTVDGFRYGLESSLHFKLDSGKWLSFKPWIGYAFNRKALMGSLKTDFLYAPEKKNNGRLVINAGSQTLDFNNSNGMHPFINTVYSLFLRENYKKFYDSKYIDVTNDIGFSKYWRINTSIKYEIINELPNYSDFSFFYSNSKDYTSNIPDSSNYTSIGNSEYRNFVVSAALTIYPTRKPKNDGYNREYNPFPTIVLKYTTGIPGFFSSNSNFHLLELNAKKRYWLGRNRVFKYQLQSGYWLSDKNVYYSSFSVINTNKSLVSLNSFDYTYQLLPYYTYNTNKWYVGGHAQYTTKLLLLKRLPIISNRTWSENLYFNYLHTPDISNYMEFGYGVGQIWLIGEASVFTSFENFSYRSVGVKVSIQLN